MTESLSQTAHMLDLLDAITDVRVRNPELRPAVLAALRLASSNGHIRAGRLYSLRFDGEINAIIAHGDANDDDFVNPQDATRIRTLLADPTGAALTPDGADRCSVRDGPLDCDLVDWVVLSRAMPAPGQAPGIAPVCAAANP